MKKRLISMLLSVLLVVSLFAGYSLSASADTVSYNTMTYRMASGDYVLRICQRLGLNYYVCKDAIMKLNNIKENQWRFLPVGKLLTLPATDADAVVITTGRGSTATANAATAAATAASTASTTTSTSSSTSTAKKSTADELISKDTPIWYMIPYTLANGETVSDACASLGISFSKYKYAIERVNNIKNWGNIPAGTTLWLASGTAPAPGTNCIIIYRHIMQSGETAYGVVTERGLNYNAAKWLLEIVNEVYPDLASIKAGQRFDYPISTTIPLVSANATTAAESKDTKYKLTSGIDTGAATVEFFVNNARVTEAKAGDTVRFDINAKNGRALKSVVLKYANGQADLLLSSFSFVMPKCDVRLDAEFQTGHKIELKCNYADKVVTLVNGVAVNGAAKGAAVMLSCIDPALTFDEVYVNYMTTSGLKREALTNIDNGFIMPDADVTIEIALKAVPTYAFYTIENAANNFGANGSYTIQVKGSNVTRAARGAEVSIVAKPGEGYTVGGITVNRHTPPNAQIGVFNNSFTMPADDVDVWVNFVPKGNNILINPVEGGEFWATLNGQDVKANAVDEAGTNAIVTLNWQAENPGNGYQPSGNPDDYIVTRNDNGLRVNVTVDNTDPTNPVVTFRMPSGGATVTGGVQRAALTYTARVFLDNNPIPFGQSYTVSLYTKSDNAAQRTEYQDGTGTSVDGQNAIAVGVGEYVNLSYDGGSNITLSRYEVWNAAETAQVAGLGDQIRLSGCFQMPNQNVVIYAYFVSGTVKLAPADITVIGSGTVGMLDQTNNSVDGVPVGQPFTLSLSPSKGYFFDTNPADGQARLLVTRKAGGGELVPTATVVDPTTGEVRVSFAEMPAEGVEVVVTFDKIQFQLQLAAQDEAGNPLNGGGYWKVTVNKTDTIVENLTSTANATYGDNVVIALTEAGESQYSIVSTIINGVVTKKTSFSISGSNALNQVIPVTVVLKQKDTNWTALNKSVNDAKRGSMDFVITASAFGYSTPDLDTYVSKAFTGDTVAIVPRAVTPAMYDTDETHIRVNLVGGGYIVPTPQLLTVGGQNVMAYVFDVPKEKISNIRVDFVPVEYNLNIDADSTNPATYPATTPVAKGLFQVSYSDGTTNSDVMLSTTFKNVPYNSTVKITLTPAATAQKPKVEFNTDPASHTGLPADAKISATTITFKMPAANTNVGINVLNAPGPAPAPAQATLPAQDKTSTYNLQYYWDSGMTDNIPDGTPVDPGSTVYVKVMNPGPGEEIQSIVFDDGTVDVSTAGADGKLVVVGTEVNATVNVTTKSYRMRVNVTNPPPTAYTISVSVGGGTASVIDPSNTLTPVGYNDSVTITVSGTDVWDIDTVTGANWTDGSLPDTTTTSAFQPDASVAEGAIVDVTINFKTPEFTLLSNSTDTNGFTLDYFEDQNCTVPYTGTSAEMGKTLYVKPQVTPNTDYATKIVIDDDSGNTTIINASSGAYTVQDNMKDVTVTTAAKTVKVTLAIAYADDVDASVKATVKLNGTAVTGSSITGVKNGDVITVTVPPASSGVEGGQFDKTKTAIDPTAAASHDKNNTHTQEFTIDLSTVDNDTNVKLTLPILREPAT